MKDITNQEKYAENISQIVDNILSATKSDIFPDFNNSMDIQEYLFKYYPRIFYALLDLAEAFFYFKDLKNE